MGKKLIEAVLYFDGGSRGNPGLSAGGAYLVVEYKGLDKIHREIHKEGLLIENATNNEAEYTGLIVGLQKALELGVTNLKVFGDSQLIINHVKGSWTCRQPHLQELLNQVKLLVKQFDEIDLEWIPRSGNKKADEICNRLMDEYSGLVPEPIVEVELTEPKQPSNKLHRLVLRMLNKKQRSFKDMANLKVNGKDEFSYKKLSELSEMLTKDELFALSEEWLKEILLCPTRNIWQFCIVGFFVFDRSFRNTMFLSQRSLILFVTKLELMQKLLPMPQVQTYFIRRVYDENHRKGSICFLKGKFNGRSEKSF
jgi:ribonuclease HI